MLAFRHPLQLTKSHYFHLMANKQKNREKSLCFIGFSLTLVFEYNTKSLLISES